MVAARSRPSAYYRACARYELYKRFFVLWWSLLIIFVLRLLYVLPYGVCLSCVLCNTRFTYLLTYIGVACLTLFYSCDVICGRQSVWCSRKLTGSLYSPLHRRTRTGFDCKDKGRFGSFCWVAGKTMRSLNNAGHAWALLWSVVKRSHSFTPTSMTQPEMSNHRMKQLIRRPSIYKIKVRLNCARGSTYLRAAAFLFSWPWY